MWDMLGLECLFDVGAEIAEHDAWEKEKIVSILKEQPVTKRKSTIPLQMMIHNLLLNGLEVMVKKFIVITLNKIGK